MPYQIASLIIRFSNWRAWFWYRVDKLIELPGGLVLKNPPAMQEMQEMPIQSLGQKMPWRRVWQPTPVFLPGKSQGQKNLAGYSPWGHRVGSDWSNRARTHAHTRQQAGHCNRTESKYRPTQIWKCNKWQNTEDHLQIEKRFNKW